MSSANSSPAKNHKNSAIQCPICQQPVKNLDQLNRHVDAVHIISGSESDLEDQQSFNKDVPDDLKKWFKKIKLPTSKIFDPGELSFNNINKGLLSINEFISTPGSSHASLASSEPSSPPQTAVLLPGSRDTCTCTDEENGLWIDNTVDFHKYRKKALENSEIRRLQLARRLENQLSGLVNAYYSYYYDKYNQVTKLLVFQKAKAQLESMSKTYWQDNSDDNCTICSDTFKSLVIRKHHCRVCGILVCDNNCSMEVPVKLLVEIFTQVQQSSKYHSVKDKMSHEKLRICLECKSSLYKKHNFIKDVQQPSKSSVMRDIEDLVIIKNRINKTLPKFESAISQYETALETNKAQRSSFDKLESLRSQVTQMLSRFEKVSKAIIVSSQKDSVSLSANEQQLIMSIRTFSVNYLQESTQVMKKFQKLLMSHRTTDLAVIGQQDHVKTVVDVTNVKSHQSIVEIKKAREELMIVKEQQFLIGQMIEHAKKERKFDEVVTLKDNLRELDAIVGQLSAKLGDQGFE